MSKKEKTPTQYTRGGGPVKTNRGQNQNSAPFYLTLECRSVCRHTRRVRRRRVCVAACCAVCADRMMRDGDDRAVRCAAVMRTPLKYVLSDTKAKFNTIYGGYIP